VGEKRPAVLWTCHNAGFAAAVSDVSVSLKPL
jgi:energy-coupling factor transport system ATP-binding protein